MTETGTPWCFTVDGESAESGTVTARDRDTGAQTRISIDSVARFLDDKLNEEWSAE